MKSAPLLLLLASSACLAQMPDASPLKLGLWQTDGTNRISGTGIQETTEKKAVRACVTESSWKDFVGQSQQTKRCERKESYANHVYLLDFKCAASENQQSMSGHLEMTFDTSEAAHAKATLEMSMGKDQVMHVQSELKAHFVSGSCGSVKPGEEQDIE